MDSRIKFEQWLGNPLRCKIDENGNYLESALQMMWEGWQACSEDTDELKQQRDQLLTALEHILEYWNRDANDRAMFDALDHIGDVAQAAIAKVKT